MLKSTSRLFRVVTVPALLFVSAAFTGAYAATPQTPGEIVGTCQVAPDYFTGNCPPTVAVNFDAASASSQEVADVAVALGERLQRAELENDIPLCIDLSEGILQLASYASDATQRDQIIELARSACCVRVVSAEYGLLLGGAALVPVTGNEDDGDLVAGSTVFTSLTAKFNTDGVRAGDILVITSGGQQGFYQINGVTGANTLDVAFTGWDDTEQPVTYEIRRPANEGEFCEPGAATAAIASIPVPADSATSN